MPRVTFPQVLQRHVECPPVQVAGATLREVLDAAFAIYPTVRSYVLDEAGHLRQHMTIFVDGVVVRDRERLATNVRYDSQIDILQALSGG
ncbi:MAG: MoaD/ThiS family protein [Planctomycetes bacterium]|nr:MoaD/ThiS family protein [Planctomycetota bacterium]